MTLQDRSAERRKHPRIAVTLHAHCQIGTRYVKEALGDLSRSGFFLRTREAVPPGSPIRAAVAVPAADGPHFLTLVGQVARVTREGLGIVFSRRETSTSDLSALERYLGRSR